MKPGFALRLALRESRHGARRVGVYMASITLGVAALVSIHSFREDVARSVREEADVLMGANARLNAGRAFPDSIETILDSLAAEGVGVARVTTALSMVLAEPSGDVRLLQVQAVEGGFPFYGDVRTDPEGLWESGMAEDAALVDPAVLTQLRVAPGDTLVVGRARLVLAGTVDDLPTDLGFQTAIGPRVYLSQAALRRAELLGFGSLARYEAYLRIPEQAQREALDDRYDAVFDATRVRYTLAEEQARDLANGVRFLGRFLALVGLGALMLGGVGVASAVHVYIREKRPGVAVLRCLGADQGTVFAAYLLQASALGLLGALLGVVAGVGVQQLLPGLLAGALPVEVETRISPVSALAGLAIGVWVAAIFALIPLLQVRDVPPLQALRQDFEGRPRRRDGPYVAAYAALAASVLALCVLEAPEPEVGLGFAAALAVAVAALAGVGWGLVRLTRRLFPRGASYPVRQGVSNLFRPQNQTVSVTLALGFGAFVVGTLLQVQESLVVDLSSSFASGRPNVLLFDIQRDQREGVIELLPSEARGDMQVAPLVPARIAAINGESVEELRQRQRGPDRPEGWAVRREYRNTYRGELGPAETLVSGRWWDGTPGADDGTEVEAGGLARVSLEVDVAADLRVGLGDTIVWNVAGARLSSVVSSLRRVEWHRLEPNFFAVFEPGALDDAPQTTIMVARIPDPQTRAAFQRDLVRAFPNVSALDFSRVQEAIDGVLVRVRQAVGFLGAFAALAGVLVLIGAVAASRVQRMREGALLKTLGARRGQVLAVLLSEYVALGTLATAAGLLLSGAASAILMPTVFDVPWVARPLVLIGIWAAVVALTVAVGVAGSRSLLRRPPLA
ncbi:MAG TPA: FtsX-like permease family protein, partial [Longimicrobiales bacterium]|nr:FtsX-like permease family protein [Longimicrobiales bacterium]